MSVWTENDRVLNARFPEAARRIRAASALSGCTWLSSGDSRIVVRHWLEGQSWSDGVFVAVSGLGDGNHVSALLDRLPSRSWVFVTEAEPSRLKSALEHFDLRRLLEDPRVLLATGGMDESFFDPLGQIDVLRVKDVRTLVFSPEYNRDPSFHARAFTEVARQIDFRRKLFGTAVADAALWQSNTFANLATVATAPDVSALAGIGKGLPMIIVSAGPSLDESIEFLREAGKSAVVVAVNSSYRAIRRAGIVPHFVMAADPRQFTARGFEEVCLDGTWLVTTPIVDPRVARMFGSSIFSWSGSNQLVTELRKRCGLPPGTTLVEQGTVSACAVDLAAVIGCDRVCLVGQDLAIREDGRTHVADSFYTDLSVNHANVAQCRRLPGNRGNDVPVEEKLYVYLKTFEQLVARRQAISFLNTAMYGARIEGVPYADFAEAKRWLGDGSSEQVSSLIRNAWERSTGRGLTMESMRAVLKPTEAYAQKILRGALRLAAKIENLPERYSAESFQNSPEVVAVLRSWEELKRDLQSQPKEYRLLEAGRTRIELFRFEEFEPPPHVTANHWRQVLEAREFAWAIAEGAWFLDRCMRRSVAPG